MSKAGTKFLLFLVGVGAAAGLGLIGISLLTQFVAAFQQGADPASIFHGHTLNIPLPDEAQWLTFDDIHNEPPTRSEQEEIISAYWRAWDALGRARLTSDLSDLPTYWAGDAYRHVIQPVSTGVTSQMFHTGHALRLTFFSDDGSVVAFRDEAFELQHLINQNTITLVTSASVIMTLDNGFWRIRTITLEYR